MTSFTISIPTAIHFGEGISAQASSFAKDLAAGHPDREPAVMLVVDPGIKAAPWLEEIRDSFRQAGMRASWFEQIQPNPVDEDVYLAANQIKGEGISVIVAIGGGSTMDTAKAASVISEFGGQIADYAGWGRLPGAALPVIAIPTTAGSGSEATSWAVITHSATHAKLALGDPHLAPAVSLVDPLLTLSMPPGLTSATGMDALTHSIEAYLSALSNPVNDLLALESIRLVAGNLRRAFLDGQDVEARRSMMLASTLGGIAINSADVAGVHCLTEGMGSIYNAPHGLLNAILLPYFMEFWQSGCQERFVRIAQAFGAPPEPQEALNQVVALVHDLHLPPLKDLGVKESDLPHLASLAEANVSNPSNPLPMKSHDYQAILEVALNGVLPGR